MTSGISITCDRDRNGDINQQTMQMKQYWHTLYGRIRTSKLNDGNKETNCPVSMLKTEFMSSLIPLSFEWSLWCLTYNYIPADYKNTFTCKVLPKALLEISTRVWCSESLHRIENTTRSSIVSTTDYILHQWNCFTNAKAPVQQYNTVIPRLHLAR